MAEIGKSFEPPMDNINPQGNEGLGNNEGQNNNTPDKKEAPKEEVDANIIESVKSQMDDIDMELMKDGFVEFSKYAEANPQVYLEIKKVIDGIGIEKFIKFIDDNGYIFNEDSHAKFKNEYNAYLKDESNDTSIENNDVIIENGMQKLSDSFIKNLDKYSGEDQVKIKELLANLEKRTDEEALEYFKNKDNMQEILEIILNAGDNEDTYDKETYEVAVTLFKSTPALAPVFHELQVEYNYPNDGDGIEAWRKPKPNQMTTNWQIANRSLKEEGRKRKGNMLIAGNEAVNLKTGDKYLLSESSDKGYVITDMRKKLGEYKGDYKYRLEKNRIEEKVIELRNKLEKQNKVLENSKKIVEELESDIKGTETLLKEDEKVGALSDDMKESLILEMNENKAQLEKERQKAQQIFIEINKIEKELEELKKDGEELDAQEEERKRKFIEKVEESDKRGNRTLQIMENLGIFEIQPILVKMQGGINKIRGNLDLGEGNELVSNVDFERGEFGIKANRYDVTMIFINVLLSGKKGEPLNPNLSGELTREVNPREDYSSPKFMKDQLVKYGIITGIGNYNYNKLWANLEANFKNDKNTQKNENQDLKNQDTNKGETDKGQEDENKKDKE